ncbi:MAG: ATP-binding protein [Acidobacteriia bacterium]|nr:ATP-binding protein [Terriglobia bacterium]
MSETIVHASGPELVTAVFRDQQEAAPDCPYVGLVPFSDADAPRFFGREKERTIIMDNLKTSRLTLLYGSSGVGKSSVLRAGVVYHLRRLPRQNPDELETRRFIVVYFNSWREDPVRALRLCIQEAVQPFLPGHELTSKDSLADKDSLAGVLRDCSERANATLLIILDQFEEYFLYHPRQGGEGAFDVEFPHAFNQPGLRANFLISMREDSLAQLDRLKGRIPNILSNYLRIEHLDKEAARAAIEEPLKWYNTQPAAGGRRFEIEPALVTAVLEQVAAGKVVVGDIGRGTVSGAPANVAVPQQAAAGKAVLGDTKPGTVSGPASDKIRIETPFLQLVMTRLWEEEQLAGSSKLRLQTLNDLGGAAQIINKHLDKAMGDLSADEQKTAATIFQHLVTPSGVKIAQTLGDLAAWANTTKEQLKPLLDRLCGKSRVLRSVEPPLDRPGDRRYQIFHDVLAPAVLDWRARWIREQQGIRALQVAGEGWLGLDFQRWLTTWAEGEALRRAIEYHASKTPKQMLAEMGVDQEKQNADWHNAEIELTYEILENRSALTQIDPKGYRILAKCWLEEMKRVKAYYIWLDNNRKWTPEESEVNYREGWKHILRKLQEGPKFDAAQFTGIRKYIEEQYLTGGKVDTAKAESLIGEKAYHLWKMTGDTNEQQNWDDAVQYAKDFYANITRAVEGRDIEARNKVAEALQATDRRRHLVNAFELAIAVSFLPAAADLPQEEKEPLAA